MAYPLARMDVLSWVYRQHEHQGMDRATRLWDYLDEILPKPPFSLCAPLKTCFDVSEEI